MVKKIVVIGSGNVAGHLSAALDKVADVVQVFSRNIVNAESVASRLRNAEPIDDLKKLRGDADLYLVAIKDDAIQSIAAGSTVTSGIWVHTSGSVPAEVFKPYKPRYGVFYPLQTFNKSTCVDIRNVPILIESNTASTTEALTELARRISDNVGYADSGKRRTLHRAAVFACNFTNYMWLVADDILHEAGLNLSILEPLLKVTLDNALKSGPRRSQTGPARRGDTKVMENHMSALPDDRAELYRIISQRIMNEFTEERHEQNRL